MKKWSSLLLLIMLTTVTYAQKQLNKPNIVWGEEYKRPNFSAVEKIIGSDDSGTYIWRNKSGTLTTNEIIIEHYDNKLKLDRTNSLNIPLNLLNNDFNIVDIFPFAGQIVALTSFYDRGGDKNTLFAQTIDKSSLQLNDKRVEVAEINAKRRMNKGGFDYAISRDSSKLLIYSNLPFERRGGEKLSLNVYNEALDLQWKKTVELPFPDRNFQVESYEVDKDGNVYLLGKLVENVGLSMLFRQGTPNYSYVIVAYRNDGDEVNDYEVSLGDDFITDLTIRIGNNGDLVCAGFYSERTTQGMKGAFFSRINAETKEMYDIKKGKFKPEFLEQFMSKRRSKKKRGELYNYRIDRLVLRSDGGALMIAEQFYIRVTTRTDANGFTTTTTTYYYNDIIAVNINPDGTIAWAARIPKRQSDGSGAFSSYAMSISKGKIYFIYNDHPKNITRTNYRKIKNFNGKKSIVTLATLSPDGTYEKIPLFSNRDERIVTRPRIARQTGKNELVIFGTFKKRYKFGKIEF
jgi:hypothetical protein